MIRNITMIALLAILLSSLASCIPKTGDTGGNYKNIPYDPGHWLVDVNDVFDGGPGKDGIPALIDPPRVVIDSIDYLNESDRVIGFKDGDEYIAYPQAILDWHEIVNDHSINAAYAVIYCPLTGTAAIWNRIMDGEETSFGVSGLLYQNNIIPYDRASNSNWSQMLFECINGPLIELEAEQLPFIECTWATWKAMYPQSKVVGRETGYNRPYGHYPYGDYKENDKVYFPLEVENTAYPRKERIHAVLDGRRMMLFDPHSYSDSLKISVNEYRNGRYLTILAPEYGIFTSYKLSESQSTLLFEAANGALPIAFRDQEGNEWDVFGEAVKGPRKGEKMEFAKQMTGYWFALSSFYQSDKKIRQ